ncbi:fumarylacetoacetate hydrolase family protein [Mycobacterium sp.]|uniref:fumarylacetoacetate hydrolase family protein n=1 Tax=Mycobacterium sp. TaxID=1785 RepID=UPI002BF5E5C6|nr:fumarylacetoacetate hydrolase family protein [Mycobacterium sp.]HKP41606.1 fumarylacetoacetate hydrolase family protein [Mycobacterium sp.]
MRLVTYLHRDEAVGGVLVGGVVCPLSAATARAGFAPVSSVREFLGLVDPSGRESVGRVAAELVGTNGEQYSRLDELPLLPPVPDPDKIICLALNSKAHCVEAGIAAPAVPWFFPKWRSSLVGHHGVVNPPAVSHQLDWEGEVALVIGSVAKHVTEDEALSYIAGVMPFNDLSARDLLRGLETIALTKSGDHQAPCGPALVSLDEIDNLDDLAYRTRVNGVVKQNGSTSDQIFNAARTLASLTRTTTLVPGDIVSMGTLTGVGVFADPPHFLDEGDVVEVEIDGVGTLRTRIGTPSHQPVTAAVAGVAAVQISGGQR